MSRNLKLTCMVLILMSSAAPASAHGSSGVWTFSLCAGPSVDREQVPWSFYQMIPCWGNR